MAEPSRAVFLSYASQDAIAAQKICAALRTAGVEVWFDQSELRGGDVWDQKIRREIRDCTLFIPVISANTVSRHEGYFRLEWDLADQRTHRMARNRVFVVPVVLDTTLEAAADVPESFLRVQWTHLPADAVPPAFVERVQRLLFSAGAAAIPSTPGNAAAVRGTRVAIPRAKALLLGTLVIVLAGISAYLIRERFQASRPLSLETGAFTPPPHSLAVLPFVNMSADKEQEYFSDGLTEELLNALAGINELQVAARTSSFSFKGKDLDIGSIARKLNVGAVLEGSVRRSGNTVRITAQLINAVSGFHLWSQSYDRKLGDILELQSTIAQAVANALSITLLKDTVTKLELGGTHNPAALDAYLRASKLHSLLHGKQDFLTVIKLYSDAIQLDPGYALALTGRAEALSGYADSEATGAAVEDSYRQAQLDARQAIALAPDLGEAHLALAVCLEWGELDFRRALAEYEQALRLAPGRAQVLRNYGVFAVVMGRTERGLAAGRRAVELDPVSRNGRAQLARSLFFARRYEESIATWNQELSLDPEDLTGRGLRGLSYYVQGDLQKARASCEQGDLPIVAECRAITYARTGNRAGAQAALASIRTQLGDDAAWSYVRIYAQWGDLPRALEWLETSLRLKDSALRMIRADPLLDPLRTEPRFRAVMQTLRFPD